MLSRRSEERAYASMTASLGSVATSASTEANSISSEMNKMSQVTAVALNMIIAPLTFGFFLHYFVSPRVFSDKNIQLILTVLGGAAMLFVEMILYVIRFEAVLNYESKGKGKGKG